MIKKCCIEEDEEKTSALWHWVPGWMAESKFALWVLGVLVQLGDASFVMQRACISILVWKYFLTISKW